MEPCAPGTEDDPPIMYSTLNKQATEQERLLKQKAVLKNGQYKNIFELSYVNGSEHWFCNACQCPVMGRVYQHEIGRRHSQNVSMHNRHEDKPQRDDREEEPITVDIAPGEPVPPGFEEEIGRVSQIQERLDGFKVGPLVALEYLLELQDYDPSKEPFYLCILCDKRGDPRTVLTHLASYNHISQYLQKHFPTCYRALAPYMTKQYKRNWQVTLQKIAEAIEKKFGRLKPYPIDNSKFEKDRMHYLQMICKGKHFSEQTGWTFEELVVHDELIKSHGDEKPYESTTSQNWGGATYIEKPFKKRSPSPPVVACPTKKSKPNTQSTKKQLPAFVQVGQTSATKPAQHERRRSLSSVSSISSSDMSDGEGRKKGRSPRRRESPSKGRPLPYQRRRSPSPRRKSPPRRKGEMPWQNPNYQKQKNEFTEKKMTEKEREKIRKIEEFRKLGRAIENDMHKTLKQHEKNPEKHPQYNEEWKKFWNKRYKELQTQGVDAAKYDFKPEWIEFWNKRMIELHSDELRNRKEALRKRLGLPEEINPIKFRIGGGPAPAKDNNPNDNKPNLPMAAQPDQDNEVIIIDDKEDEPKSCTSPWEKEDSSKAKPKERASPLPRIRRRSPRRSRSRERNLRSPARGRSKSRERYPTKRSWSKERHFTRRSRSGERMRERDVPKAKDHSPSRGRSRSKDYRSPSREMLKLKDRRSPRDRRSHSRDRKSRDRSRERREKDRLEYRESSYERDMRGKDRVRTVADLPWEREKIYRSHFEEYYKPPPIMRDATRKPVLLPDIPGMAPILPEDDDDNGEVNIVDVLRILTALEERLGSLGPKVNDLLAQALALEKKEANSSDSLLDSDLHCVLFETVKEKLKGQLLAGLVDIMQERAFKKAIKKTATLLHMAGQRKKQRDKMMTKINPVIVPGVGTVDKAAIAKQIATALIMQGKTDVTQTELEYLINAVVGMAEASKNSNKPITTASFLQQITAGTLILPSAKEKEEREVEEKIIIPSTHKKSNIVELEKLTEPLTPSPGKSSVSNMENLSDLDLQTLLQNFKDLSTDEQHNLINYLKKLEIQEPERVERLRQFVNLDPNAKPKAAETEASSAEEKKAKESDGRHSPFSNRHGSVNPASDDLVKIESEEEDMDDDKEEEKDKEKDKKEEREKEKGPTKVHLDSEDEDYTFEDVVKAVSKNVKDKELEDNMKIVEESMRLDSNKTKSELDLTDAKTLISNLMSNFSKSNSNPNSIDLLGLGMSTSTSAPSISTSIITSTADFAKTLSSINVANLTSIVNNAKKLTAEEPPKERPLNFEPPSPLRGNGGRLNFDLGHLNRPVSPRMMDRKDPMRIDDMRRNVGLGRQGLGGFDIAPPSRGPGGPLPGPSGNLRMPGNLGYGGPGGMGRDNRGPIIPPRDLGMPPRDLGMPPRDLGMSSRDLGMPSRDLGMPPRDLGMPSRDLGMPSRDLGMPPRDLGLQGPGLGFRDRPPQYPRGAGSFASNFGRNSGDFPPLDPVQYPPRPKPFDQRNRMDSNPRFGNVPFNNRSGGDNYNRW